ncbi:MAG: DNA-binding protein [Deltaproteobacteria bacterium]|nr:DNA-binding protein [Deltaproteobacteria bacterium]
MGGLDDRAMRILEIGRKHPEIRAESEEGTAGRIITARLRPGTDFLGGIKELTKRHNILAGALVVSFGSLAKAEISWKEGSKPDPSKKDERIRLEGPLSFLSSQGRVGITEDGEAIVHVHGVLIDLDGRCWGAHFYEGDNPVYSTFEIVIQEIAGIRHTKVYDEECEVKLIKAVRL